MEKRLLLGALERKVMNILWDNGGKMCPRDVMNALDDGHAYTTIMTILCTLFEKGLLERNMQGKTYYYLPTKSKSEFATNRLNQHFDSLLSDFGELAITQFVDSIKADQKALEKLESYLKEINDAESV